MIFTIEPMINAGAARHPRPRRRLDDRHCRITACRRNGSTRCWSPTRGYEVLTALGRRRLPQPTRSRGRSSAVAATLATAPAGWRCIGGALEARTGVGRDAISRRILRARPRAAAPAGRAIARLVDRIACAASGPRSARRRAARSIAVGGYGRGQLFSALRRRCAGPAAAPVRPAPLQAPAIERFIGLLWDAGLEVAHAVRTIAECETEMAGDIIDTHQPARASRQIAGSRALYTALRPQHRRNHSTLRGFYEAKALEQQQRHLRYQDTAYNLEPNVKESPGVARSADDPVDRPRRRTRSHRGAILPRTA